MVTIVGVFFGMGVARSPNSYCAPPRFPPRQMPMVDAWSSPVRPPERLRVASDRSDGNDVGDGRHEERDQW